MATKTQYYNLDKPNYDEVADIEVINANFDKIDQQMRNNADGVNFAKGISSDAYDNSKSYAVGDYCIYDNKLYRCITAIESAEAFNIAKWEQTTVGKEVEQLNSNLDGLQYSDIAGGKNKLNSRNIYENKNGVTISSVENELLLNGTATGTPFFVIKDTFTLSSDMTLSFISTNSDVKLECVLNDTSKVLNNGENVVITSGSTLRIHVFVTNGKTVSNETCKIQLEEGTVATNYEPYIPSVKMLAEEVSAQNESLDEQGLLNKFDGSLGQGYIDTSTKNVVSSTSYLHSNNPINVNAGDILTMKSSETLNVFTFIYNKADGSMDYDEIMNAKDFSVVVPSDVKSIQFNLKKDGNNITPSTAPKINLYVNNEIDSVKADLGGLSFSVSGTTLSITNGTNTWTLPN